MAENGGTECSKSSNGILAKSNFHTILVYLQLLYNNIYSPADPCRV